MSEFEDKLKIEALFRDAFTIFSKLAASFLAIFLIYFMADMMLQNLFGVDPLDMFKASAHTGWYVAFLFLISTAFSGIITASSWSFMTGAAHPVQNGIRRVMQIFPVLLVAAALSGLAVVFGLLLLIVPGVVVALALTLVTQVMVVENPGPMAALQRSYELTNGHKMQIFFIMLILMVAILIMGFIGSAIVTALDIGDLGVRIMDMAVQGFFSLFSPILVTLIYASLSGGVPVSQPVEEPQQVEEQDINPDP